MLMHFIKTNNIPKMCQIYQNHRQETLDFLSNFTLEDGTNIEYPPRHFLKNFGNSCAIDSLLYIIFFCKHSYFINIILNNPGEYETKKEFRDEILPAITELYGDHKKWRENIIPIQKIISKWTQTDCFEIKSGTHIWSLFADAFMNLQFKVEKENYTILATYLGLDIFPSEIKNAPHVVLGDDDPPKTKVHVHPMEGLEAVLFFVGNAHYTCAIKGNDDKWFYYDDLREKVLQIKDPKNFIFNETPMKKPQLFFYIL